MKILLRVIPFLIVNIIGFNIGPALYAVLVLKYEFVNYETTSLDVLSFEQTYFLRVLLTSAVCAIFSIASFFFKSFVLRYIFLLMPLIAPTAYGLYFILGASG